MVRPLWAALRAVAYLATGVVVAGFLVLYLPAALILGMVIGAPLAAVPIGELERYRLRLLGHTVPSPHLPPSRPGLTSWAVTRYWEAATWRAFAYVILLALGMGFVDLLAVAFVAGCFYAVFIWPFDGGSWLALIGFVPLLIVSLFVATAVASAHAALARGLLGGQVERKVHDLTESRARLLDSFDSERRRIERDLHDGAQQRLVSLSMTLGLIQHELRDGPSQARALAVKAGEQAHAALVELRELVRGIHPQVLTDHGLAAAVSELADRSPVPVTVRLDVERLPSIVESTAYFVVAEAITNAVKHAKAKKIAVNGWMVRGPGLVTEIRDDGLGGADPSDGTGLAGLADRVAAIGGVFTLSSPLGGPTIVHLELPCYASS